MLLQQKTFQGSKMINNESLYIYTHLCVFNYLSWGNAKAFINTHASPIMRSVMANILQFTDRILKYICM